MEQAWHLQGSLVVPINGILLFFHLWGMNCTMQVL